MALFFSCSIWRIGYVLRIKRIRLDRYFRKLGKSRKYIAPVEGSLKASKRGEIEGSRARKSFLGGLPQIFAVKWWVSKGRGPAGFLRNNREMGRTLHQDFGVAHEAMVRSAQGRTKRPPIRVRKSGFA